MEVDWDSDVDDELALQCLYRAESEKANFKSSAQQAEKMEVGWDSDVDDELALQCLYKAERDREDEDEQLAIQSVDRTEAQYYQDCLEVQRTADEVAAKAKAIDDKAKAEVDDIEAKAADAKADAAGIDRDDVAGAVLHARQHAEQNILERLAKKEAWWQERCEFENAEFERIYKAKADQAQSNRWRDYAEQKKRYNRWIRIMAYANHRLRNQDEDSKVNRDRRFMTARRSDAKTVDDYVTRKKTERKDYYKILTDKAEEATGMFLSAVSRDVDNISWSIPPVVKNFKVWKTFNGVFVTRQKYGPFRTSKVWTHLQESGLVDMQRAKKGLPPLPFHDLSRMMCFAASGDVFSISNEVLNGLDPFNTKWYEKELYTPLDVAASRGQMSVVEYLTANFKYWTHYGQAAIREAAKNGYEDIVSYLARSLHYSYDRIRPFDVRDIFSHMIVGGSSDSVDRLLGKKRNARARITVNTKNDLGDYPIGIAAASGNSEMVSCLLRHGADFGTINQLVSINSYDGCGRQPTHLAALYGHHLVIEMLVNAGAEFDNPTFLAQKSTDDNGEFGNTPLHFSAQVDCVSCCKILIDNGASIFKRNNVGDTPLHVAVFERSLRTVIYLVQRGADVTIMNDFGDTPCTLATEMLAETPDDNVWQHICDFFNGVDDSITNECRRFPNLLVEV